MCLRSSIDGGTHPICQKAFALDGASSAVVYRGIIKKLVHQYKYDPFVYDLKSIMTDLMYEGLIQHEAFVKCLTESPIVTAVPLSFKKYKKRGYNHAELLAKDFAIKFELTYIRCLTRVKDTKPQYTLKKEERLKNIQGAFDLLANAQIKGKSIFLIDDLATTYSTLRECAKVLKRNGASHVWGVTFAREE